MIRAKSGAPRRLVIVESPAKAKTIAGLLGRGYVVESSLGHIRDLPSKKTEVPAAQRDRFGDPVGVDVDGGFVPLYVVPAGRSKEQVRKLKAALKDADELLLATDEDREGEAIAWHLREELRPKVPVRRMVFHEITPDAIQAAVQSPRDIDENLVDAQETRRIVDRLYGYEVSPVLWRKVMQGLSAGRVQSVATRLVVDRERERMAFRAADYWDLVATLDTESADEPRTFDARLATVDGRRVAAGRDFDSSGQPKDRSGNVVVLDGPRAHALASGLRGVPFQVRAVEAKPYRRSPYAPFRTTTLQQEAARKLGFGAARTMQVAQRLYEGGYITYMRTDSTTLSDGAVAAARAQVGELYGPEYLPETPRRYESKVKSAQEAHEAIRPAGDRFRTPAETGLTGDEFRLYELVWMRTVASQMRDAVGQTVSVRVGATARSGEDAEFVATGKTITFFGFLKAYVEGADDPEAELDDRERRLPALSEGQQLHAESVTAEEHSTKPPARYTEATLVKELEERDIGRPSTYATIIRTILDRGYVFKKGTALVPSWLAFAVVRLLEQHFGWLVDYEFTARMEDRLDEIAAGRAHRQTELARFWSGENGFEGLKHLVDNLGEIDARGISSFPLGDGIVVRVGRYGPYVEDAEGNRGSVPPELPPDELTLQRAAELLAAGTGERQLGVNPSTGRTVVVKAGRYGPYVTEVLPDDAPAAEKPPTASLLASMSPETVTLDDALRLLSLPRVVGADASGAEIIAANGRYGPYVKKGSEFRSLPDEESIFTVTVQEAEQLFAGPKGRRGRPAAAAPLRELGADPATGKPLVVKDGRYGPYVTDGEVNVTVPRAAAVDQLTLDRAAELIAEKRAKGPTPRKRSRR
ncbi:MAG: type I DNA topoisomerase [Jiangellaceae bacterium]|nr:type I DNA topoisomerase [Jiangellaceae bacterium]